MQWHMAKLCTHTLTRAYASRVGSMQVSPFLQQDYSSHLTCTEQVQEIDRKQSTGCIISTTHTILAQAQALATSPFFHFQSLPPHPPPPASPNLEMSDGGSIVGWKFYN